MNTEKPKFLNDVFKDYIPVYFGRVSSSGQRKGLPTQMTFIRQQAAQRFNFKKTPLEFSIVQSGREGELKVIEVMTELVEDNPKKKYVAVFRDVSRIARNAENTLALTRILSAMGVPMISLDMSTLLGNKPMGDRSADLLFLVQAGIAQVGKDAEQGAQQEGAATAASLGLVGGQVTSIDGDKSKTIKGRLVTPWRRLYEAKAAIANKDLSVRGLSLSLGYVGTKGKTRGEPLTSKPRKIIKFLNDLEDAAGIPAVLEYLDVIDELTRFEKRYGRLDTPKGEASRKVVAVNRVSRGYRRAPTKFPNPVTKGNPAITEFLGNGEHPGTVADAINNPKPYLPNK